MSRRTPMKRPLFIRSNRLIRQIAMSRRHKSWQIDWHHTPQLWTLKESPRLEEHIWFYRPKCHRYHSWTVERFQVKAQEQRVLRTITTSSSSLTSQRSMLNPAKGQRQFSSREQSTTPLRTAPRRESSLIPARTVSKFRRSRAISQRSTYSHLSSLTRA